MRPQRETTALIMIASLAAIFLFPAIFASKTFYLRDLTYIFHPWKTLCAQAVQSGELPLWNSYAYCGMPLLANWQTAVFAPFGMLFTLFDFTSGLKIFHFLQIVTAGYFAYLFGRKEFGKNSAALTIMVLFAFNGFFITKLEFLSYAGVISWTFALLLFRKNPIALGLSICFSFLAGHQVFVFQIILLAIFMASDLTRNIYGRGYLIDHSRNAAVAILLSLGLAALQIFPTLELIQVSYRKVMGIDYAIAMLHSLNFSDLAGFIHPSFSLKYVTDLVAGEYLQWDTTVYVGFTGIVFALYGSLTKGNSVLKTVSLLLVGTGLLLAMGDNTPVYPWLYRNIFIFHTMRYPAQYAYFALTGITLLAGAGVNSCGRYSILLAALLTSELLILAAVYRPPTASNDFFTSKPETVKYLQSVEGKSRFILSPGTEKNRFLSASSVEDGWQNARSRLYNLTCLPYRLANAYGFGEPLTSSTIETKVNNAYSIASAKEAASSFKGLGTSYLICEKSLADPAGYTQETRTPLYVYKIDGDTGIYKFLPDNNHVNSFGFNGAFNKYVFTFDLTTPKQFVWKESRFTGWSLFLNGAIVPIDEFDGIFPVFKIPSGKVTAYYLYMPIAFKAGLFVTLLTILTLIGYAFKRLCASNYEKP